MSAPVTKTIPEKWRPRYLLQRIGSPDIDLSEAEKNQIDKAISEERQFISLHGNTLKVKMISAIVQKWKGNIPPRPKEIVKFTGIENGVAIKTVLNQDEIDLWDELFGSSKEV